MLGGSAESRFSETLHCNTLDSCFFSKDFKHFVGPNGVRPRASAAGPYTFGCGSAALRYMLRIRAGRGERGLRWQTRFFDRARRTVKEYYEKAK